MIATQLVLLFLFGSVLGDICPSNKYVDPCYCRDGELICDYFAKMEEVEMVLNKTKGMDLNLRFQQLRFNDIAHDYFSGQVSRIITFSSCRIFSFERPAFSGMENHLERLEIETSLKKSALKGLTLSHMNKLRQVHFESNIISRIENGLFRDSPSLESLFLEGNGINELENEAFASLSTLKQLNIADNNILQIQRSMFPTSSQLEELDLSYNHISELPVDIFSKMPKLKDIDVRNNNLITISKEPWEAVWSQLEIVDFVYNPIVCDEAIRWIYKRDSKPGYFAGSCARGNKLRYEELSELTDSDFDEL